MRTTDMMISLVGIIALVLAIIAGAALSQSSDAQNETDSFGTTHTAAENGTITAVTQISEGSVAFSSGILVFAAVIILIVIILAAYALTRRQKW